MGSTFFGTTSHLTRPRGKHTDCLTSLYSASFKCAPSDEETLCDGLVWRQAQSRWVTG